MDKTDNPDFEFEDLTPENMKSVKCLLTPPEPTTFRRKSDILGKTQFFKVLTRQGQVLGVVAAERSAWDTEHFGFGVGKITFMAISDVLQRDDGLVSRRALIEACCDWMKQNEVKCVIARVDLTNTLDIMAYEQSGFYLTDVLATFHLNVDALDNFQNQDSEGGVVKVASFREGDEQALMDIARSAFKVDHFHRDFHFPKHKSDELFAKWAYNCCHGLCDTVLVAKKKEDEYPLGFIACRMEHGKEKLRPYGVIELVAVSPAHQGKGVGTLLVREAVKWFGERGVHSVYVATQADNKGSARTYEKVRFNLEHIDVTLHKWLEESQ